MARLARLFVPGCPQHILHRGHNAMAVFLDDADRQRYLDWLVEALRARSTALHAYALLPGQVGLLVTAARAEDASAAMAAVARRYGQHFNRRYGRTGTIWEGRFRSTVAADDAHVLGCYRFVDASPVRAQLVEDPAAYAWSSCAHHVGRRTDAFVTDHAQYWALGNTPFERQAAYERLCRQPLGAMAERIAEGTLKGWALGEIDAAGASPSRRATPLQRGRPRRTSPHDDLSPLKKRTEQGRTE